MPATSCDHMPFVLVLILLVLISALLICGCGEPVCELNRAWNVTFKPSKVQTPDVNLAPKSRDAGIQCDMELYELNRGLPPLVWPRDWVADNSDAPEID